MKEGFSLRSSLLFKSLFGGLENTGRLISSSPGETESGRDLVWVFSLVLFFFFFLPYYREDFSIIVSTACICIIMMFGFFFASPTMTDPWIHQQMFVGRLAQSTAPNSAKQPGAVTTTDLSHAWYKTVSMTILKIAATKECRDQPLFRAVAHWAASIRMTHGQLYILHLCSDWMLGWGGKEGRTQTKHNHDEVKHPHSTHLGTIIWSFRMLHKLFAGLILHWSPGRFI